MTVKEIAQKTGLSQQAIYKRLKAHGVKLDTIKDKETGQFTPDGETIIKDLFLSGNDGEKPAFNQDSTEVERLNNQVEKLTTEVERLNNQVEKLKAEAEALQNERDFLRVTLEREQQLHGLTISKLPTPPPALPPAAQDRGRLRALWDKIRGRA